MAKISSGPGSAVRDHATAGIPSNPEIFDVNRFGLGINFKTEIWNLMKFRDHKCSNKAHCQNSFFKKMLNLQWFQISDVKFLAAACNGFKHVFLIGTFRIFINPV